MLARALSIAAIFLLASATVGCRQDTPVESAAGSPPPPAKKRPPNILVYMVDTLRADELGCYGAMVTKTPAIDGFASEGELFERAATPTPATRPAVASLLTGVPPYVHGVESYTTYLSEKTGSLARLPALLRSQGYHTAAIVANPNVASVFGFETGFDEFHEMYAPRESRRTPTSMDLISVADDVVRRVKTVLESAPADKPYFVFALAIDPHAPYSPPAPHETMYDARASGERHGSMRAVLAFDRRLRASPSDPPSPRFLQALYRGEVSYSDAAFGELIEWMRETQRLDEAMVVLTADHGEEFVEHGVRGHGQSVYEAVTHIPLIIRHPEQFGAGRRCAEQVDLLDLSATLLAIAGGEQPNYWFGRDLRQTVQPRPVFTTNRTPKFDQIAIRSGGWKLIEDRLKRRVEVYSLKDDPDERHPLRGAARVEVEERLASKLVEFERVTHALNASLIGRQAELGRDQLPDDVLRALRALGYVE